MQTRWNAGWTALAVLALLITAACDTAGGSGSGTGDVRPPTRNMAESLDDAGWRQQGYAGPCAAAWLADQQAYFDWQNGAGSYNSYVAADQGYRNCLGANNYPADNPSSESGPPTVNADIPLRDPYENEDDYRQQQQGQVGPCSADWNRYESAYNEYQAGGVPYLYVQNMKEAYQRCVDTYYPQ